MKQTFTIWVFWIIQDENNRVLLCLRNDYEFWNLPGGWLETWETPREWMMREAKEETWLDITTRRLAGVYSKPDRNEVVFVFECIPIWWKITLNEEAKDIQYFTFDDIPSNTPPKHIERIKDFLENKGNLVMKIQ